MNLGLYIRIKEKRMQNRILPVVCIVLAAAFMRLIPHVPNFTPLAAMALFAGSRISQKWLSYALPFAALLISDAILEFYGSGMISVYASFGAIVFLGSFMKNSTLKNTLGFSIIGSFVFYLISNFVFINSHLLYPHTMDGMINSYIAAIPFFGNAIMGDLFYNVLFWSIAYAVEKQMQKQAA